MLKRIMKFIVPGKHGIAERTLLLNDTPDSKEPIQLTKPGNGFIYQNAENERRNAELIIANIELANQNDEKEKLTAELIRAKAELLFQNGEKEYRAAELLIANKELLFQNGEKEKRAAELIIANKELAFQNREKGTRAAELITANRELLFQNKEKEKRAAELIIANEELAFQNGQKEKLTLDLISAIDELALQYEEKEKRAAELDIANQELAFQNNEKGKRAAELTAANRELEQFAYIASHDLQQPLRTVSNYMQVFEEDYLDQLDENAAKYINAVKKATTRMSQLITSLLNFSRLGSNKKLTSIDCNELMKDVISDLNLAIKSSGAIIKIQALPVINAYETELMQVFQNLITNAIKFHKKDSLPEIEINAEQLPDKWKFSVSDNGIGISEIYFQRVFDIFQRLHTQPEYEGSGIGLANCKKIIAMHGGEIWIEQNQNQGVTFFFTIPNLTI